jgi:hypothetical protein
VGEYSSKKSTYLSDLFQLRLMRSTALAEVGETPKVIISSEPGVLALFREPNEPKYQRCQRLCRWLFNPEGPRSYMIYLNP